MEGCANAHRLEYLRQQFYVGGMTVSISVRSYYSQRPRFDPHPRHLSNHRARRMLNTRLHSFSKNDRLNMPCPMKWQYYEQ